MTLSSLTSIKIKKRYIVLLVILVLIFVSSIKNKQEQNANREFFTVEQGGIVETITLAGDIDMKDRVDLGFGISGRVARVLVEEGQTVSKGDVLAELSMAELQAELTEARARLQQTIADQGATRVDLDFTLQNLENVRAQQDVLVESAYRALLNESLTAYAVDGSDEATPPTISGVYMGSEEGEYVISAYSSGARSGYSFNLSGLEGGFGEAFTSHSGPLGTQGLFIQFEDGDQYARTEWVVPIPNTRSPNYVAKKNAYDQAVAERDRAIASAEDAYLQATSRENSPSVVSRSEAERLAAEAAVSSVQARLSDGYIRAPFDGVVGLVDVSVGEIVSSNTPYITLVGAEEFELILDVPEIDVAKLQVGDKVSVLLDAYQNQGLSWDGVISAIDVIDTVVDGVPVYKTTVSILNPDENIRVGMGAKATILAEEKQRVLRAPLYFFAREDGTYTARVMKDAKRSEVREVTLGLIGSDGFVEVVGGLSEGDIIVHDAQ